MSVSVLIRRSYSRVCSAAGSDSAILRTRDDGAGGPEGVADMFDSPVAAAAEQHRGRVPERHDARAPQPTGLDTGIAVTVAMMSASRSASAGPWVRQAM